MFTLRYFTFYHFYIQNYLSSASMQVTIINSWYPRWSLCIYYILYNFFFYFNEPIEETKHKFCRYDAYSTTTKYEIKSRRCRYKTFATTIVPVHKVQDITERLVFIFNFTDGLYYIVYDADLFGTFKQEVITYHRTGGSNEPVLHFMIPIEQLHRIEIWS